MPSDVDRSLDEFARVDEHDAAKPRQKPKVTQ
jgi:hypothetical protein